MDVDIENIRGENKAPVYANYDILESLKYPSCIIGIDGILSYGNKSFLDLFNSGKNDIRLDWEHPLFPEYRKRVAQAYMSAMKGNEKHCFALINSPDGEQLPTEIYLFPLFKDGNVYSILALMIIVDSRLLSFDRSTLNIISEENFKYENLQFEFSPMPIMRINATGDIVKCSQSIRGFLGYSPEEIVNKKLTTCKKIFIYDAETIQKAALDILTGNTPFKRIGEVKISAKEDEIKIANLIIYPIIQNNEIDLIEIILEDITLLKELKEKVNKTNRILLLKDITKAFFHSLNNTINVIMSKTQLLLQITEKDSVHDGIELVESSVADIVNQLRRVQNFLTDSTSFDEGKIEPLADIIEDSIEFSKMQFSVENKENRRNIEIDKKYYSSVNIKTDTKLLREIIISMILKVSAFIQRKGNLYIELKENHDLSLIIKALNDEEPDPNISPAQTVNLFSGINIRHVADKINLKIIEEESASSYAIKAIFPQRIIVDKQKKESKNIEYKLRDLDIIIVEDEEALQKILFELFDKMGNRVFICENGDEALEEFRNKNYDLVLTDYGISGITGIELSARIKEINEDTVTILLSGWMLENVDEYKNVIDLFIPKPFKLDDLLKKISKVFKEKIK
ncbi:response regulator [Spirochaetota bacterium]